MTSVIVADASVIVKWLFPDRREEPDAERASMIWEQVSDDRLRLVQPPHWLAEVAAVVTRLSPGTALDDIRDLYELDIETVGSRGVYETACDLSLDLNHHFFDTLYHAVALRLGDAILITADEQYYTKARKRGRIVQLADFDPD